MLKRWRLTPAAVDAALWSGDSEAARCGSWRFVKANFEQQDAGSPVAAGALGRQQREEALPWVTADEHGDRTRAMTKSSESHAGEVTWQIHPRQPAGL